jgi:PAS domain S-box-containing protein
VIDKDKSKIRQAAEKKYAARDQNMRRQLTEAEQQKNLQELQIHQIELEMQQEELRREIEVHKQLEEALNAEREKFSKTFQTSPYAMTITRAADGKFIDVNDAFIAVTGYSREETLASSSLGLKLWVKEADRQRVVAELLAGRAVVGQEYQFRTKPGRTINGLFYAQTVPLGEGSAILSSIDDITERRKMEGELQEAMKQLTLINEVSIGNELKLIKREEEVDALLRELGRERKYGR